MDVHEALDSVIREITRAHHLVKRKKSKQVNTKEEKQFLQSIVYSWRKTHRPIVCEGVPGFDLGDIDSNYVIILESSEKNASRNTYLSVLKDVKGNLVKLRTEIFKIPEPVESTSELAPDFTSLAADAEMQTILIRRWEECKKCLKADANLAATVMMGGLLEALFVAKANKMVNLNPLFNAKSSPKDKKTKKPLSLKYWTLNSYIEVGYELKWVRKSGRDIASVLRDYRNYIHPEKERSHGIILKKEDATLFWEITKLITHQLLQK